MLQHTAFKELITKAWIQPPSMTTLNRDSLQTDGLEWWFHVVMLKIAKYDFSKDFGFQRSSCCSSCGPQNPCCSSILHKACMVHSMPATRNGKLQHARTIHAKIILTLARTIHAKNSLLKWKSLNVKVYLEKSKCSTWFENRWWIS